MALSLFLGSDTTEEGWWDVARPESVSETWITAIDTLKGIQEQQREMEERICQRGSPMSWDLSTEWMGVLKEWMESDDISFSVLSEKHGCFEGNVYRAWMKCVNVLNEVISMATYSEHVTVVDQLVRISERMRQHPWMGESLYVK